MKASIFFYFLIINGTVCLAKNVQLNRDEPKSDKTDEKNCKTINGTLFSTIATKNY